MLAHREFANYIQKDMFKKTDSYSRTEAYIAGTADLFTNILLIEEGHGGWQDRQRDQIVQIGIQNYIANQTGG